MTWLRYITDNTLDPRQMCLVVQVVKVVEIANHCWSCQSLCGDFMKCPRHSVGWLLLRCTPRGKETSVVSNACFNSKRPSPVGLHYYQDHVFILARCAQKALTRMLYGPKNTWNTLTNLRNECSLCKFNWKKASTITKHSVQSLIYQWSWMSVN